MSDLSISDSYADSDYTPELNILNETPESCSSDNPECVVYRALFDTAKSTMQLFDLWQAEAMKCRSHLILYSEPLLQPVNCN